MKLNTVFPTPFNLQPASFLFRKSKRPYSFMATFTKTHFVPPLPKVCCIPLGSNPLTVLHPDLGNHDPLILLLTLQAYHNHPFCVSTRYVSITESPLTLKIPCFLAMPFKNVFLLNLFFSMSSPPCLWVPLPFGLSSRLPSFHSLSRADPPHIKSSHR